VRVPDPQRWVRSFLSQTQHLARKIHCGDPCAQPGQLATQITFPTPGVEHAFSIHAWQESKQSRVQKDDPMSISVQRVKIRP
jgi:hypothetical protein